MGDNKRKLDLEDEMSRFEQEIAKNLPPPPKVPNNMVPPPWMHGPPGGPPGLPFPPGGPPVMPVFRSPMNGMPPPHMGPPMGPGGFIPPPPGMMVPPPGMMPPPGMVPPSGPSSGEILPPTVPLHTDLPQEWNGDPHSMTNEAGGSSSTGAAGKKKKEKKKTVVRVAGGEVWEDTTLMEWDNNDFRIFVGDLGNEVSDDALLRAFSRYPSLLKARVVRDKKTKKTKGFGFVSFKDPQDYLKAMREMNGKYVGNRPVKLRKSTWKDRNIGMAKKKEKEKKKLGLR